MARDSEKGKYASPEGSATWEYIATTNCALMIFCVYCMAGWTSPTLSILMDQNRKSYAPITSSEASTLASMVALGHAIAPTLTMYMANKLGRKNSILAIGIPTIISWLLIAITENIIVLYVARFFSGLSVGLVHCLPPMYLGEIASAKLRGGIAMVCGTMMNTGILFMFIIVPYFSVQTTAFICLSITIVTVISVWFIPESPYFLVMIKKIEEAEGVLEKLRGKTNVSEELDLIKMTVGQETKTAKKDVDEEAEGVQEELSAVKRLLVVPGNRKALYINLIFQAVLQFGSYISVMAYGQIIFEKMKTGVPGHVCMMIAATLQIIFNIITASVIDRIGRRPLICISGVLSGACLLIVAVYFYLMEYTKTEVSQYGLFALSAAFANVVALNIGLMPLLHVIQSETLGTDIKELATCILGVGGGVMAIIGVKLYLMLAVTWDFGHSVPFFVFVGVTWIGTAFILKLLPETKGKTLFEIQKDLNA